MYSYSSAAYDGWWRTSRGDDGADSVKNGSSSRDGRRAGVKRLPLCNHIKLSMYQLCLRARISGTVQIDSLSWDSKFVYKELGQSPNSDAG